jgi:hypothetical protein
MNVHVISQYAKYLRSELVPVTMLRLVVSLTPRDLGISIEQKKDLPAICIMRHANSQQE